MTPKIKKWFVEKSGIGVQDLGKVLYESEKAILFEINNEHEHYDDNENVIESYYMSNYASHYAYRVPCNAIWIPKSVLAYPEHYIKQKKVSDY